MVGVTRMNKTMRSMTLIIHSFGDDPTIDSSHSCWRAGFQKMSKIYFLLLLSKKTRAAAISFWFSPILDCCLVF